MVMLRSSANANLRSLIVTRRHSVADGGVYLTAASRALIAIQCCGVVAQRPRRPAVVDSIGVSLGDIPGGVTRPLPELGAAVTVWVLDAHICVQAPQ